MGDPTYVPRKVNYTIGDIVVPRSTLFKAGQFIVKGISGDGMRVWVKNIKDNTMGISGFTGEYKKDDFLTRVYRHRKEQGNGETNAIPDGHEAG